MILGDIRNYLKQRNTVSLQDIAIHFDLSEESAALAVEYWIKKGKVRAIAAACGASCGSSCGSAGDHYQWIEQAPIHWYR